MIRRRARPHRRVWLRRLAVVLPVLALALATPVLRDVPMLAIVEAQSLDWRYRLRGPEPPTPTVAIVAIDDRTVRAQDGWPVPRDRIARAVARLHAAGAKVVALDLLMAGVARQAAQTRALARVLAWRPDTLLPVALTFRESHGARTVDLARHALPLLRRPGAAGAPTAEGAMTPVPQLAEAVGGLGHVNVVMGADGALRHLHPAILLNGQAVPALPLAAARRYLGVPKDALALRLPGGLDLGAQRVPVGPDGRWTLRFYGPRGSFPTVSLQEVLDGSERVADTVGGRIVWLGATATAVGDTFVTPFDPTLPGVEAFATATANLLTNTFLERGGWATPSAMAAVLLVGLLTFQGARLRRAWLAIALAPLPLLAWTAVTQLAFVRWALWLNWTVPAGVGVATLALVAGWRVLLSEERRRRLAAYLPEALAPGLAEADRPAFAEREQHAGVLFVDLAGFTRRSEAETPAATAALLKHLHTLFDTSAHAHAGYVDSFIGDGAMLVFGVPEPSPADPANALACARHLLERTQAAGFTTRIGAHYGSVQLTIMGGHHHRQVSLAGDTVNIASRLVDVAKEHTAVLAVSEALAQAVAGAGHHRLLGDLAPVVAQEIRGRTQALDVRVLSRLQPIGRAGPQDPSPGD